MRTFLKLPRMVAALSVAIAATSTQAVPVQAAEPPTPPDPSPLDEPVRDLSLDRPAISPNGDGAGDSVVASFAMPETSPSVEARVVDPTGATVTTLGAFESSAARVHVDWNGTDAAGVVVPDGDYRIELTPTSSWPGAALEPGGTGLPAPAPHSTVPVRVDRTPPVLRVPTGRVRLASRTVRQVRVPIIVSESSSLAIVARGALGVSRTSSVRRAGRSPISVPITRIAGLRRTLARSRGTRVKLFISATDDAGNTAARAIPLRVLPPLPLRLSWPIRSSVASGFGPRWGRQHQGIDLVAGVGTPIHAAADGRVVEAGYGDGFGQLVKIDHGEVESWYAHQSSIRVRAGQLVKRGQVIGLSGATGQVTGPHLHFEVHRGGSPINPLQVLAG